ncbi:MAG TPA: PA14 domain-containing protein [Bacteroidales bacterium]|nr:PA14 domain-containing protein [Bacteroidales bacterium]
MRLILILVFLVFIAACSNNGDSRIEKLTTEYLNKMDNNSGDSNMPGLIGVICEGADFTSPSSVDILKHLNHDWSGGPSNWSGYWRTYITAPYTGEVTFSAEVDNGMKLMVGSYTLIDMIEGDKDSGTIMMKKGEKYPAMVWYFQDGGPSYARVFWSWLGQNKIIINESAFSYSQTDKKYAVSQLEGDFWSDKEAPFNFDDSGSEPLDLAYQDGRLLPVVGVENYQVFRSNREYPQYISNMINTYNHAPMICYWNNKYYLEFLSAPKNEHDPNTETLLTTSVDGKNWETPRLIFPAFVPEGKDKLTVSHQRMGFYISKDNRLLILSFYGMYPSPNEGNGIGRAVREIYKDGSVGPLYFIRYNKNAGWDENNTPFPFYKTSPDKGFIKTCDELMADKVMVQQWWEEDRSEDGFYLMSGDGFKAKAFNWYTRNDSVMVGLFKAGYATKSSDRGKTWSDIKKIPSIIVGHGKMWGQKTKQGNYALVYNPHFEWRYPLVTITSADGEYFKDMSCVHGELPPMRYQGSAKDVGPQYVRGIVPGNGNPPGDDMWLTYSMHKEDIWVSRVPDPIRHSVDKWVNDNFDNMEIGGPVTDWNIYSLVWAPVNITAFPNNSDKSLMFKDSEPYDYAKAVRVFPESKTITALFELCPDQNNNGRMEVEILNKMGGRPVRIIFNDNGMIQAVNGEKIVDLVPYYMKQWVKLKISANATSGKFDLFVNDNNVLKDADFTENVNELQRISFRTGEYRQLGIGNKENINDLPDAGESVKEAVYYLNNVLIEK